MEIRKIGVLGAGQMGGGIAQIAATSGFEVVVRDIKMEYCERGLANICRSLDKRIEKGKLTVEEKEKIVSRISLTDQLEAMSECDMIIEAAPEDLQIKQDLFEALDRICNKECILCTNTSSMSIEKIMEKTVIKERCCGMHFFFPVAAMRLVEVIRFDATSDETVEAVKAVAAAMGKEAVLCKTDTPGFIVNRCLFAMMLEAVHCYEMGVATPEDIDKALKLGLNHPMGPFEMMDMSGLDTFPHVCESLVSLPITDWSTPESVEQLVSEGRFGRKNGHGWYDYN